jgi:hypothetical protein
VPELDGEPVRAEDIGSVGIDVDEIVRVDRQPLERAEEERLALPNRPAEDATPLQLTERRLLALDSIAERIEALEMIPGVQGLVAVVAKRGPSQLVRAAPGDDVHDPARGLAEFSGVGTGGHLELAHRLSTTFVSAVTVTPSWIAIRIVKSSDID